MPLWNRLRAAVPPLRQLPRELVLALALGLVMNSLGHLLCIAHFLHWWQVATCYWGYVLPVAWLVRRKAWADQFAWGVVAMVPLELAGYGLGTSVPCPGNLLETVLGIRNFSLAMVVLAAPTPLYVNLLTRLTAREAR